MEPFRYRLAQTTNSLANFANGAGGGGSALVWGLVIDAGGNGFSTTYDAGLGLSVGIQTLAGTDDVFFIQGLMNVFTATQVTNGQADGQAAGDNRVTTANSVPFGVNGIGAGDSFRIIWIDRTALGGTATGGTKYGMVSDANFAVPGDGATLPLASLFAGAEPLKQMTGVFVPEPSSALLGLLGVVWLLFRRR